MAKKKAHHEEHVDETWLIPYSDMLTLLLALFIVMFAMSEVDKEKMQRFSQQFNVIFSGGSNNAIFEEPGETLVPPQNTIDNTVMENDKMTEIKLFLDKEIEQKGYSDKVKVMLNHEGLEIAIQDIALFKSGDDKVIPEISPLLLQISKMLDGIDNSIKIVGHTDNVPVNNSKFRSNWDLSAMRAINVMNFLVEKGKLRPERFSIQGYGEYKPEFDNSTADGRSKNRRVEIFVVRKYPINTN